MVAAENSGMSFTSPLRNRRSSFRSTIARMIEQAARRDDSLLDRNTSPTDFVLRDYRYVR